MTAKASPYDRYAVTGLAVDCYTAGLVTRDLLDRISRELGSAGKAECQRWYELLREHLTGEA